MAESAPAAAEKKQRPIVPFLRLGEQPSLLGLRCRSCAATFLKSGRVGCAKCGTVDDFEEIALADHGHLWVYSIVHQSVPGVPTPYVAAIVDLPEGVSVRCNLVDVEPDPGRLAFGMPVRMVTRTVRTDKEGNDVVAFFFRPA
jgi:uncharacterized OB-fold protein